VHRYLKLFTLATAVDSSIHTSSRTSTKFPIMFYYYCSHMHTRVCYKDNNNIKYALPYQGLKIIILSFIYKPWTCMFVYTTQRITHRYYYNIYLSNCDFDNISKSRYPAIKNDFDFSTRPSSEFGSGLTSCKPLIYTRYFCLSCSDRSYII
jgi:hypothetical protein